MKHIYRVGIIIALSIISTLCFGKNKLTAECASVTSEQATLDPSASPLCNTMEPDTTQNPVTNTPTVTPTSTGKDFPTSTDDAFPSSSQKPGGPVDTPITPATLAPVKNNYCKITYILNGGTNHKDNSSMVTVSSLPMTLKNAKKSGYTFRGWYLDHTFHKPIREITNIHATNLTLYARWKKVTIKTVFLSSAKRLKGAKIKVKIKTKQSVTGYEYVYATDAVFSKKYRLRTTKNPKILSRLKKKKIYYIKVRAYKTDSTGKKIYGKYSKIKKIRT